MTKLRLDRLLANLGYGTRRTVQNIVNNGEVTLDGEVLKKAEKHIVLSPDLPGRMQVLGEPLDPLPGLSLVMHKPLGYTCSRSEEEGKLVYGLLPERWALREPALSTVGRLDKETSGLLLFTDDGALLHKIISPKYKIFKEYRATLARPLRGDEASLFSSGELMLPEETKPLLPAQLTALSEREVTITISEGRYHQVRRMFAAVGNEVLALHRARMGALALPVDLEPGAFRVVTAQELQQIFG